MIKWLKKILCKGSIPADTLYEAKVTMIITSGTNQHIEIIYHDKILNRWESHKEQTNDKVIHITGYLMERIQ